MNAKCARIKYTLHNSGVEKYAANKQMKKSRDREKKT